jgi:putative phage-type endonuclease
VTQPDRAEWLSWRRSGIGASDVAAVLGISPWASPFTVWVDKLGLLPDEDLDDDDPREFGRRAETMIAPWFTDKTGLEVAGEQTRLTSGENPWMLATLDGMVYEFNTMAKNWRESDVYPPQFVESALCLGPLEIKTDNGRPWDEIPAHYQCQGQWQMAVGGWDRMWFAVLHGRRFRIYELERDQADIDLMKERALDFWVSNVMAQVPPTVDGSEATEAVLRALYPDADPGKTVELGDHGAGLLRHLATEKRIAKATDKVIKEDTNQLRSLIGDAYQGVVHGRRAVTLATQTRKTTCRHCGAVDESAPFRVLRPTKEFS